MWGTLTVSRSSFESGGLIRFNNNLSTISTTQYTPLSGSGVYLWGYQLTRLGTDLQPYSKTTTLTAGNGFVTTWYDQSGLLRHSTQVTSANQPNIVNAGVLRTINGKPSIYFSGSQLLTTTDNVLSTGNAPYSIHGVSYNIGTSSSTLFYAGGASNNNGVGLQIISGGVLRHFWYTKEFSSNPNSINLQTYYAIKFDGANAYTSVNNTSGSVGTGAKSTTNPTLSIGKMKNWNEYYVGHQQELVLFDLYNNPTTESGIKSNINSYYSIY